MLESFDHGLIVAVLLTPVAAVIALVISLFFPLGRIAAGCGLLLGLVGFAVGATAGGGFNQTAGLGLGSILALVLAIAGGGAGFLLGAGGFHLLGQRWGIGMVLLAAGLLFPVAALLDLSLKPKLLRREFNWWRTELSNPPALTLKREEALRQLSKETRQRLANYIPTLPGDSLPRPWLEFLYEQRLADANLRPLPLWFAEQVLKDQPRSQSLAANPTTPTEILSKLVHSIDFRNPQEYNFLNTLVTNPALLGSDVDFAFRSIEAELPSIHDRGSMSTAFVPLYSLARERQKSISRRSLEAAFEAGALNGNYRPMPDWLAEKLLAADSHDLALARNETTPGYVLSSMAHAIDFNHREDYHAVFALVENPSLLDADAEFLTANIKRAIELASNSATVSYAQLCLNRLSRRITPTRKMK